MTNLRPPAESDAGCRTKTGGQQEKAGTGQLRRPVEDEEEGPDTPPLRQGTTLSILGMTLSNDVEEDGCPATYPTLISVTSIKQEKLVTEQSDNLIDPTLDKLIKPTPDPVIKPTSQQMIKPTSQQMIKPTPDQLIKPTSQQKIKPTPDQMIKPTPDQMIKPTPHQMIKPTDGNLIKPTTDKLIKPTADKLIKPTPDKQIKPTAEEVKTGLAEDSPLKTRMKLSEATEEELRCRSEPLCDKAAKELSNLLKSLSVKDEAPQAAEEDDSLKSMLNEIDSSLAELRLHPPSNDHKLKGRGVGDEGITDVHSLGWYQGGEAFDLQAAADLANFFSREYGDMFGNQQNVDQLDGKITSAGSVLSWDASNTCLNSTRQPFPYVTTPSNVSSSTFPDYLQDTTGPPSSTYRYPTGPGFEERQPTSYLGLLACSEEPSSQLSDTPTGNSLMPSAKRTKYMHHDTPGITTPTSTDPTSDTTQLAPLPSSLYDSTQPTNIYRSSLPVNNTVSGLPVSNACYSPAHRLSPEYNPYHSPSSGYISSPGAICSPCPSSAVPDSPSSVSPNSPSDSSPGSLSPNNSPTDSGLSCAHWSPYSQPRSVTSSFPFSPGAAEISMTGSLSQSAIPQPQTSASVYFPRLGSSVSTTQYSGQAGTVTATQYSTLGGAVNPAQYSAQGSQIVHPSADQVTSRSPTASAITAPMSRPPVIDFSLLLFEYTDEDGDSILHTLVLIYENLAASGKQKSALSFLQYIAQNFLSHPFMKHKLNKQNHKLQTPLYQAVQRQLLPVVRLLLKSGADPNIQGRCEKLPEKIPRLEGPLHAAVSLGDEGLPLVRCLLEAESTDINLQNTLGETSLHIAAREHGAVYSDRDSQTRIRSCVRLVKLLMDYGADPDVKDFKSGKTPVMVAIETKDIILVKTILECCNPRDTHALLNESTYDLNTCMHLALGLRGMGQAKHVELVRMLLKKGGEAENENNTNLKAKDMAPTVFKKASKISR